MITTPSSHDIGLWELDNNTICQELSKLAGKKPTSQSAYSDEDRYLVAKYAKELNTLNKSKYRLLNFSKYTAINESIVRAFVKRYDQNVKVAKAWGRSPDKKLNNLMQGRSLMVGPAIDEKVRKFMVYFIKSGNVGRSIAAATAMVLASRTDGESVNNLFVTSTWRRNLLQRIGLRRWAATAAKVKIPESPKKEAGLQHSWESISIVEKYTIPEPLVIKRYQRMSKYVQLRRFTMALQSANKVGVAGIAYKRMITLTLTVTMDGKILWFQVICKGKIKQPLQKVNFPAGFSLNANIKHHSNTQKVLKHLDEIAIPYVDAKRKKIGNLDQFALLLWDIFWGQKTNEVTSLLTENKIFYEYVPNDITGRFISPLFNT